MLIVYTALHASSLNHYASCQLPPKFVPLRIAAKNGHLQAVQKLLEGGANVNHQCKVRNMLYSNFTAQ